MFLYPRRRNPLRQFLISGVVVAKVICSLVASFPLAVLFIQMVGKRRQIFIYFLNGLTLFRCKSSKFCIRRMRGVKKKQNKIFTCVAGFEITTLLLT